MPIGTALGFTAVVTNAVNTGVTWSVTCGSANECGSFDIIEGGLDYASYTAPSTIPAGNKVTISATSVADTTKSVSATIALTAKIALIGVLPAALQVSRTAQVSAKIGDGSAYPAPVQWTVSCGAPDCGTFNPNLSNNGMQTTYSAPAAVPPGGTVTITATSVPDPTQSVSANMKIIPQAPTLKNGTYVFQITSNPLLSPSYITGVFIAKDGAVVSGEEDWNSFSTPTNGGAPWLPDPQFLQIIGGSYGTTPDGNLQVSLENLTNSGNLTGTEVLEGKLNVDATGFVAQIYGPGGAGTLELQTSTSAPSGGYALSLQGSDHNSIFTWVGGILNVDGAGALSGAGSALDIVENSNYQDAQPLLSGTVSTPDEFGRVNIELKLGPTSFFSSLNLAGYMIDATHMRLTEIAGDGFSGALIGVAMGQGTHAGQFGNSSFAGSSYVFGMSGFGTLVGDTQVAGVLTANSDGTLNGTLSSVVRVPSDGAPRPITGSWSINPDGRVTLSNVTDGTPSRAASFTDNLDFYLTGDGNGLLLSRDASFNLAGEAFQQQPGALGSASFNGTYGINAVQFPTSINGEGGGIVFGPITSVSSNGTDQLEGFVDSIFGNVDIGVSGSFTDSSNGVLSGTMTGLTPDPPGPANTFCIYLVDSGRAIAIQTDSTHLTLGYLNRVQ